MTGRNTSTDVSSAVTSSVNRTDVVKLFDRLQRLVAASKQKTGNVSSWDHASHTGETHRYTITGLKTHEEVEDSMCNLLIWVWNAKDYLKKRAVAIGKRGQLVEQAANKDRSLMICADLANRLKHGASRKSSRSHLNPRLGNVSFRIPQETIGSLTFGAYEVDVDVKDPNQVNFSLPVIGNTDDDIGDAFDIAEKAICALERIRESVESE